MQSVVDKWDGNKNNEYHYALTYNRKLWVILVAAVTTPDNPLPVETRQNVANLGLFIFNETIELTATPNRQKYASLVHLNRQVAGGLLNQPDPVPAADAKSAPSPAR